MKIPFLFKAAEVAAAPSWPWRSCATGTKTLSFRAATSDDIYRTINSAYIDEKNTPESADTSQGSSFTICNSSEHHHEDESAVINGLRSDRLFFEPGQKSSILEVDKTVHDESLRAESVTTMAIDSSDPFLDFRVSMEEMMEAHHGPKDWDFLKDLLGCYLGVNDKSSHGYIVEAFTDLLIHLAMVSASDDSAIDQNCSSSSTPAKYSFTSPLSFSSSSTNNSSTSPCLSSMEIEDEDDDAVIVVVRKKGESSSYSSSSGV